MTYQISVLLVVFCYLLLRRLLLSVQIELFFKFVHTSESSIVANEKYAFRMKIHLLVHTDELEKN